MYNKNDVKYLKNLVNFNNFYLILISRKLDNVIDINVIYNVKQHYYYLILNRKTHSRFSMPIFYILIHIQ